MFYLFTLYRVRSLIGGEIEKLSLISKWSPLETGYPCMFRLLGLALSCIVDHPYSEHSRPFTFFAIDGPWLIRSHIVLPFHHPPLPYNSKAWKREKEEEENKEEMVKKRKSLSVEHLSRETIFYFCFSYIPFLIIVIYLGDLSTSHMLSLWWDWGKDHGKGREWG